MRTEFEESVVQERSFSANHPNDCQAEAVAKVVRVTRHFLLNGYTLDSGIEALKTLKERADELIALLSQGKKHAN